VPRGRFLHGINDELRLERVPAQGEELAMTMGIPGRAERRAKERQGYTVGSALREFGLSHYSLLQFLESVFPKGTSFLPD
jgi:hypothetical protein